MMKQSNRFVVHCKSQEEWNTVLANCVDEDLHLQDYVADLPYLVISPHGCASFSENYYKQFLSEGSALSFEEFSERFLNKKDGSISMSNTEVKTVPFKSDGGSSDYYKIILTNKAGYSIEVEMGDIIRQAFGNDFDLGNIVKACRRISEAKQGRGKAGVDVEYDANKIIYFANEVKTWHGKS